MGGDGVVDAQHVARGHGGGSPGCGGTRVPGAEVQGPRVLRRGGMRAGDSGGGAAGFPRGIRFQRRVDMCRESAACAEGAGEDPGRKGRRRADLRVRYRRLAQAAPGDPHPLLSARRARACPRPRPGSRQGHGRGFAPATSKARCAATSACATRWRRGGRSPRRIRRSCCNTWERGSQRRLRCNWAPSCRRRRCRG